MLFEGSVDGEAAHAVEGVGPVEGENAQGVVFGKAALVVEETVTVAAGFHHGLEKVDGVCDNLCTPADA